MVLLAFGYLSPLDRAHVQLQLKSCFLKNVISWVTGLRVYSGGSNVPAVARLEVVVRFSLRLTSESIIPPHHLAFVWCIIRRYTCCGFDDIVT